MNQPMTLPQRQLIICILSGPDKGAKFKISGTTLTIGREEGNDIQIKGDPSVSRQHLRILIRNEEAYFESLNEKNPMLINKNPIKKAIIENNVIQEGFKFVVGKTQLELTEETKSLSTVQKKQMNAPPLLPQKRKSPVRLILYSTVVIAVLLLFFTDKKDDNAEKMNLRTEEKTDKDIASQREVIKSLKSKTLKSGKTTIQFKKSQAAYIRGFRDYKQGQYERAILYFQECLSIYPAHILCNRYLGLTQKRFNELIQHHMIVGKKSLEKKQYGACMASFKNVIVMVKDPSDKVYMEAKSNYEICNHQYKDRF